MVLVHFSASSCSRARIGVTPGRESTGAGGGALSTVLDLGGDVREFAQAILGASVRVHESAQAKLASLTPSDSVGLTHDRFVGGTVAEDTPRAVSAGNGPLVLDLKTETGRKGKEIVNDTERHRERQRETERDTKRERERKTKRHTTRVRATKRECKREI